MKTVSANMRFKTDADFERDAKDELEIEILNLKFLLNKERRMACRREVRLLNRIIAHEKLNQYIVERITKLYFSKKRLDKKDKLC